MTLEQRVKKTLGILRQMEHLVQRTFFLRITSIGLGSMDIASDHRQQLSETDLAMEAGCKQKGNA